jgi:D-sedoheptulose 7-phosphate isomerase
VGDKIFSYFEKLGKLLLTIQATDRDGVLLELSTGIEKAINLILSQTSLGHKVIFIGNGGSAAIASHQAMDCWRNGCIRAIAFNDPSLLTCISNDFGYQYVFEKPIEMFADAGDVLIAISSSGHSENILNGVRAAKRKGCSTITMSGFDPDNPLRSTGNINFYVPSYSYGYVEISHLSLCHYIVDTIIERKNAGESDIGMEEGHGPLLSTVLASKGVNKQISVTVVVPALNEEKNLEDAVTSIIATLENRGMDWEIILVNDGSTDSTGEIAIELASKNPRIKVLHHERPMGIGYNFREGVAISSKDAVSLLPGDGEACPYQILKWLPLLEHVDIVNPFIVNKDMRSWDWRMLAALYLLITNLSFGTTFRCITGNVIYRRGVFGVVNPEANGFFHQTECLVKAVRAGFTFAEVPVRLRGRLRGESKALSFRSFRAVVLDFLRLFIAIHILHRVERVPEHMLSFARTDEQTMRKEL